MITNDNLYNSSSSLENFPKDPSRASNLDKLSGPYHIYKSPEEFEQFILSHYEVAATNIEDKDILQQLSESNVVILGESHNGSDNEFNAQIINQMWTRRSKVLTEDGSKAKEGQMTYVQSEIADHSTRWDPSSSTLSQNLTKQASLTVYGNKFLSINSDLLKIGSFKSEDSRITEFNKLYKTAINYARSMDEKIVNNSFEKRIDELEQKLRTKMEKEGFDAVQFRAVLVQELNTLWIDSVKKSTQALVESANESFNERNKALLNNSLLESTNEVDKVFIIAGSEHVKINEKQPIRQSSVEMIYRGFDAEKKKYIVLVPKQEEKLDAIILKQAELTDESLESSEKMSPPLPSNESPKAATPEKTTNQNLLSDQLIEKEKIDRLRQYINVNYNSSKDSSDYARLNHAIINVMVYEVKEANDVINAKPSLKTSVNKFFSNLFR